MQESLIGFPLEAPQPCIANPNFPDGSAITNSGTIPTRSTPSAPQIPLALSTFASQTTLPNFGEAGASVWDDALAQNLAPLAEYVDMESVFSCLDLTHSSWGNEVYDAREHGIIMAASPQAQSGPSRVLRPKKPEPKDLQNSEDMSMDVDSEFDFTSGCKIVSSQGPGPTRLAKKRTQEKQYDTGIRCTFPNCSNKKDFRRRYELERHMLTHDPLERLSCPVIGCNRHGQRGFPREDKFKDHMRNAHRDEDAMCVCPVPGCGIRELELDLLREHCSIHIYGETPEARILRIYASELRQCPMNKCSKNRWIAPDKIPGPGGHLMSHDEDERSLERSSVLSKGYDGLTGAVICPVCDYRSASIPEFTEHLEDEHVLAEDHRGFGAYIRFWGPSREVWDRYRYRHDKWVAWQDLPYRFYRSIGFTCNYCSRLFPAEASDTSYRSHVELLKSSQELLPYRRQILQLLTNFAHHPVFDDIR